jgi:hypothetical protein
MEALAFHEAKKAGAQVSITLSLQDWRLKHYYALLCQSANKHLMQKGKVLHCKYTFDLADLLALEC